MYTAWEEFLIDVPGAFAARITATLPWSGPAVLGANLKGPQGRARSHLGQVVSALTPSESGANVAIAPYFYQHPLIGDMMLRIAYELGRALRLPGAGGIAGIRLGATAEQPPPPVRPLGFARGSRISLFENALLAAVSGPPWDKDAHLTWDPRYLRPAPPESIPQRGRLLSIARLGPAIGGGPATA
jgi:hypothetical protein